MCSNSKNIEENRLNNVVNTKTTKESNKSMTLYILFSRYSLSTLCVLSWQFTLK